MKYTEEMRDIIAEQIQCFFSDMVRYKYIKYNHKDFKMRAYECATSILKYIKYCECPKDDKDDIKEYVKRMINHELYIR